MSGEGALLPAERAASGFSEFDDFVAYLEQRRDNAATMADRRPSMCDFAHDRQSQLDAMIGDLRAGLHHGKAEVRARLLAQEQARIAAAQSGSEDHGV